MHVNLIFRYPEKKFKSIENVFETLLPFLPCSKVVLNYPSKGVIARYKNWLAVNKLDGSIIHVSGFDHYLLLFRGKKKIILTIHDIEALKRKSGIKRLIFTYFISKKSKT